ncbi:MULTISPECIES: transcription factor FapR [unclassified Candidatus Frackibacter]|uniref:transcription factor FapR n=1 Tax=unclassified Candidatus Frackibacter TaxID=2648818 RepID=UPI0007961A68|nr:MULTISPECIES: transcription factor FapR [unclassified Candidatus Frackibacter]KXS44699.1 MAG: fatty acid biosynthesis transcriptional regulator protein [Candidatus Frackibacter sp. T328-2]SDC51637.1 Acyl-coenzyme A thioesterase PaaI, contains HGG motif [Candidatus Frackibacter sp. WG11]SEM41092.1 Acyl-coenzyme A thioesterase PaaI, contains HGG motif [Candidatus Frackibacter sp. WG12]SFL75651.1 Acyl-coenzyme A thioesterase PaaI, contains HGG motif [Candidatus Frackibacter sp. WG13]
MVKNLSKKERQKVLQKKIRENPFLIDRELAEIFDVSIQTIRLDRLELNIPEVRKRTKNLAKQAYSKVKSISGCEIIGKLVDIELNNSGISILETNEDMVLEKTKIVRGHHIFAQANSLAVAILDIDAALTGSAKTKFKRPVYVGERLIAEATVNNIRGDKFRVKVKTRVNQEEVFSGKFLVFSGEKLSKEGH